MEPGPRTRDDLTVVELDGEAVIYDESTGALHHLNPSATIVWSLCDGATQDVEMAAEIADAYGVAADGVLDQVREVLTSFRDSGLLEVRSAVDG